MVHRSDEGGDCVVVFEACNMSAGEMGEVGGWSLCFFVLGVDRLRFAVDRRKRSKEAFRTILQ